MKFWIWALFLLFNQGKILTLLFKKFHRSIVYGPTLKIVYFREPSKFLCFKNWTSRST
jgi:hypothetical protein